MDTLFDLICRLILWKRPGKRRRKRLSIRELGTCGVDGGCCSRQSACYAIICGGKSGACAGGQGLEEGVQPSVGTAFKQSQAGD